MCVWTLKACTVYISTHKKAFVPFSLRRSGRKCVLCFLILKSLSIIRIYLGDIGLLKLSVTLAADTVFVSWTAFRSQDSRHLIGYYVNYMEA